MIDLQLAGWLRHCEQSWQALQMRRYAAEQEAKRQEIAQRYCGRAA